MINIIDDIAVLPDVTPRRKTLFKKLMGNRIIDILWHLPYNLIDRQKKNFLKECHAGQHITIIIEVSFHVPSHALKKPAKVVCTDGHDKLELLFFNTSKHYLARVAPSGSKIVVSGKIDFDQHQRVWQVIHPDHIGGVETMNHWIGIEPVYRLTAGVSQQMVRAVIHKALTYLPKIPEWHMPELLKQFQFPSFHQCLHMVHNPASMNELDPFHPARMRLIFDEFLVQQLTLHLSRRHHMQVRSLILRGRGHLLHQLIKDLPFTLTKSQEDAFAEIQNDLKQSTPMLRLLQGDVGSGKTIVSLMAMIHCVESECQAAILAPTEILARQHYHSIKEMTKNLGINIEILTSREKGKIRQTILDGLDNGTIHILVGTHAIIQDSVKFKRLAMVVVDEQQRFGVDQRLALSQKGKNPHILSMTATPIPRTMMMANYGEMDVSVIREKPKNRLEIQTKIVSQDRLGEVTKGLKKFLDLGQKVYWVCPLIEESEVLDFTHVTERFSYLEQFYPKRVGLIHGRMKGIEKDIVMDQFSRGNLDIVIATTVIEVGVDVPSATLMVIENAERFGLSQLHQLRGRVGRGAQQSMCILLYGENVSTIARRRLEILRESNDGFFIAEEDLKLRGGGELMGTKQAGLPRYRFANFNCDDPRARKLQQELLRLANKAAHEIIDEYPELKGCPQAENLIMLMRLFDKEEAIKYRRTG